MSSEGETKTISKTQASLLEKGDKSYYYWHNKVGNKAPFVPPPLISKQIIDTQPSKFQTFFFFLFFFSILILF